MRNMMLLCEIWGVTNMGTMMIVFCKSMWKIIPTRFALLFCCDNKKSCIQMLLMMLIKINFYILLITRFWKYKQVHHLDEIFMLWKSIVLHIFVYIDHAGNQCICQSRTFLKWLWTQYLLVDIQNNSLLLRYVPLMQIL